MSRTAIPSALDEGELRAGRMRLIPVNIPESTPRCRKLCGSATRATPAHSCPHESAEFEHGWHSTASSILHWLRREQTLRARTPNEVPSVPQRHPDIIKYGVGDCGLPSSGRGIRLRPSSHAAAFDISKSCEDLCTEAWGPYWMSYPHC